VYREARATTGRTADLVSESGQGNTLAGKRARL